MYRLGVNLICVGQKWSYLPKRSNSFRQTLLIIYSVYDKWRDGRKDVALRGTLDRFFFLLTNLIQILYINSYMTIRHVVLYTMNTMR